MNDIAFGVVVTLVVESCVFGIWAIGYVMGGMKK